VRIAIPLSEGRLCQHFGHCEEFLFVDAEPATKSIAARQVEKAPEHQPGLLPLWLKERSQRSDCGRNWFARHGSAHSSLGPGTCRHHGF
jgi:hypothetical protein